MSTEKVEYEYELAEPQVITPKKRDFQMLVTRRYVSHYCRDAYEEFTSDLLLNFARDNMLFIDIGAHYGYYTLLIGTNYRECQIMSIEPVPEAYEILRQNIQLNQLENVKVYNVALTNKKETRRFNIDEASANSGFHEHPLTKNSTVVDMDAVPLDSLIDEIPKVRVIVKVDTEGHEPYILQGMKKLVKNSKDIKLIIEFNPKCLRKASYEPEEFLREIFQLGFDIYAIDDNKRMTYKLEKDGLDRWVSYLPEQDENRVTNLLCIRKKNSLSVCFFCHSAQLDDAGRSLLDLTKQLVGRSVVCSVILPGEGPLRDRLNELGASTLIVDYGWWCDLSPLPDDEIKARLTNSFEHVLNILAELSKMNPDVIFTNTSLIPWGAVVASLLGKPHVWAIHEFSELKFHLPFETVGRFIENFSNLTLFSSKALANSLLPTPRSKRILTVKDNFTDEKTGKEVVELLRRIKNTANPSLDSLSQFAARAMVTVLRTRDRQIAEFNLALKIRVAQISSLEASLQKKVSQIRRLESQTHRLESQTHRLESQTHRLESQIYQIQHSIPMQLANRYQRIVDRLLHPDTRRRDYYELVLTGIIVVLNEGWRSFFRKAWDRLVHRPAAIRKPRHDLPKFNASISEKEADELVFPVPSEKTAVSIVIPAYNQLVYTLNCLRSIAENTDGDYGVVVIDDASTDETTRVLSKVKNLQLVTNKQNAGFIESCNRGAGASKGKYILFLNNDTMVTKGWLPPLLELIKREDVGAVGSKLVYPDETLQEAGAIIWRDSSGSNYGRGDDPDKPQYNYVKEVDKCSGACLLVRRDLFEKIGGFDEQYKPAYKEDTDLCMSIRNLGYRVMYQPASMVVHFEGATCGVDISEGTKKYQEINRPIFAEKWHSVLQEDHYDPDAKNIFLARERISGKRIKRIILIIDSNVPNYDTNAGALGMYQYTKLFVDLGFKVIFLPADLRGTEPYTSEMQQYGIEVIYGRFSFDSWLGKNGKHINYAWLSRPGIATKYIDKIKEHTNAKILYCGRDLHYLRLLRKYEIEQSEQALKESQRLKEIEFMLFNSADAILTFSTFEADIISKDFPGRSNIHIIPAYLYEEFPSDYTLPSFDDRKGIAFLGGFKHSPNVDAVIWFIKECFPHVVAQIPDVKLFVVGSDPPQDIMDLQSENIVVTGYVKDLKQYFQKIKLCVAPVRWGAGVKGKIVTSMYYGVPVVTTSLGAEGMGLADGEHVLIADTPEIFAAKVAELYSNKNMWEKLSKNSLQYVKEGYSKKVALEKLLPILSLPQCYICGALYKFPEPETVTNFRETRLCHNCRGSKRGIDLARVLLKVIGSGASCLSEARNDLQKFMIYLLESRGPIHAVLSNSPNFICSEYWDDIPPGETRGNVRCEDVQNLTFPDASFDIVITQDVFEHVANPEAGFKEIHRVLKPGGYHIFTVPFNRRLARSVTRARIEGKEIIHLLPAVYHGDSLRSEGSLVFTDFGPDLIEMLEKIGFEVETYEDEHPEYAGGYNIVFPCRKI